LSYALSTLAKVKLNPRSMGEASKAVLDLLKPKALQP
jgi:hypothetical protein